MTVQKSHPKPYSIWMAESAMSRGGGVASPNGDSGKWLRVGFLQIAILQLIEAKPTQVQEKWLSHLQRGSDSVVDELLDAQRNTEYSMDRLSLGPGLFYQYDKTKNKIYKNALDALKQSLILQTKNVEGGYWYFHYPHWSYLDGMFSLVPFLIQYGKRASPPDIITNNKDVLHQIDLLWDHCYHSKSGLLVHGFDSSRTAIWADPISGRSPHVWGRALGWYIIALINALEIMECNDQSNERHILRERLKTLIHGVAASADPASGCWWQMTAHSDEPGNYLESSCTAMFVYSLYKSVRLGYIDDSIDGIDKNEPNSKYTSVASKAYDEVIKRFVVENEDGTLSYDKTVAVCSLNSPATYDYYVGQPISYDSDLGSAAFIIASIEHEKFIGM